MLRSIIPNCNNSHNLQNTTHQFLVVLFFLLYFYQSTIYYKSDIVMDDGYEAKYFNVQIGVFSRVSSNMSKFSVFELHVSQCGKDWQTRREWKQMHHCINSQDCNNSPLHLSARQTSLQSFRKIVGFCEENTQRLSSSAIYICCKRGSIVIKVRWQSLTFPGIWF